MTDKEIKRILFGTDQNALAPNIKKSLRVYWNDFSAKIEFAIASGLIKKNHQVLDLEVMILRIKGIVGQLEDE